MFEKLREKPHHIKQSISLALTIIIFCGILFVWITSLDARNSEQQVRANTVSPVTGVTSMFDGFISGFKEKMSGAPTENTNILVATTTATDTFDLSGVVIIDPSASTTKTK